mmetsp:Transcript_41151/g.54030  ORF Transcript_41151/g.54030 Transcript_41151/m.54030 type:complete len:189 (-) Transcript_41151:393-959(-)
MIIVIFSRMFKSMRIFITMSVLRVSKSPVGSSKSKILGLFAIERAIVTLCCSPPDSWLGKWSILSPRPTSWRSWRARYRISSLLSLPWSCMGSSTFSKAVSEPIRLKVWNTKPSLLRRIDASRVSAVENLMRKPQMYTSPLEGLSIVPMMLSRVVLPPPEVPRIVMNSPSCTVRFTPRRAGTPSIPRR